MPDWTQHVRPRLSSLRLSPTREAEIVEELSQHLEDRYLELIAGGSTPDEATRVALADFRDGDLLARHMAPLRQAHSPAPITLGAPLIQDIRFSFRMLMKSPGFTITAVLTLALGIGANTAIFSVFKGILLNSLPFSKPDGIVMIWHRGAEAAGGDRTELALSDYIDCRDQNKTFESIGAYRFGGYSLTGVENPEFVQGYSVTTNFFTILGVKPKLGRNFTIDEGRPGSQRVAIISEAFWRKHFASNKQIIGQSITLNYVNYTVIGIMDSSINYPGLVTDLWTNMLIRSPTTRGPYDLTGIARLKPNTSVQQALNDTHSIKSSFDKENFKFNIQSVNDYIVGDMRPTIIALFVSVTLVLLIATTNVANLILVRASTRVKEVSIRTALGAGRWHIARLLFIENILISGIGGLIGITIAFYGMKILLKFAPEDIPRIDQIKFDGDVLGWTITVSILIGVICSIILIWQISRIEINDSLKYGGRNITEGNAKRHRRNYLVIFEVALTLVLLNCAGLLAKSIFRLQQVDTGVNAERILTMGLALPGKQYNEPQNVRSF